MEKKKNKYSNPNQVTVRKEEKMAASAKKQQAWLDVGWRNKSKDGA